MRNDHQGVFGEELNFKISWWTWHIRWLKGLVAWLILADHPNLDPSE